MNKDTNLNRILLIEDDLFIRELYALRLKKAGFEVEVAFDGQEGLDKAAMKPSLILLDIMLPKMHGLEVLERLRQSKDLKEIPVFMLTNLGQESIIREAFKKGCSGYIMKMRITPTELVTKVQDFLKNPRKMSLKELDLD